MLTTTDLAKCTGLSVRFFQKLAKNVSWATKPEGCRNILFYEDGFDAWLAAGKPPVVRNDK